MKKSVMIMVVGVAAVWVAQAAYTAASYVQDGLIAQWDAIENAGAGQPHDSTATHWVDLKGAGGNFPVLATQEWREGDRLYFTGPINAGTYKESCTNLLVQNALNLSAVTLEIVMDSPQQYRRYDAYPWTSSFEAWGAPKYFQERIGSKVFSLSAEYGFNRRYTFQTTFDTSTQAFGVRQWIGSFPLTAQSGSAGSGATIPSRLQFANIAGAGTEVYAIRIYNRVLTAEELTANARVDAERFQDSKEWGLSDAVVCAAVDSATVWPFRSDTNQVSGSTVRQTKSTNAIVQAPDDWVPAGVYQGERYGTGIKSTFTGLRPFAQYRLGYYGAETYFSSAGSRVFNISVNGAQLYTDCDLYVEGGGKNGAVSKSFSVTANASGEIAVSFGNVVNNGKYGGLALFSGEEPSEVTFTLNQVGEQLIFDYDAKDALCYYLQRASSKDGPWTDLAVKLNDCKAFTNAVVLGETSYYRVVCSNGVGTTSSLVRTVKSENSVYAFNVGPRQQTYAHFGVYDYLSIGSGRLNGGYNTSGTAKSTEGLANPIACEMGGDFLYSGTLIFSLPNLDTDKTYCLRVYAVDNYYTAAGSRLFNVIVNDVTKETGIDIFGRTGAVDTILECDYPGLVPAADGKLTVKLQATKDNAQICALELVEENATTFYPLVPVIKSVWSRTDGTAITLGAQLATTRFEIQRRENAGVWTTIAADAANVFIDTEGTGTSEYRARARNAVGNYSNWCGPVGTSTGTEPKRFLGVCEKSVAGAYDGRRYESYDMYGNAGTSESFSFEFDRDTVVDPLPRQLYTKGFWRDTFLQTFTGLYPMNRYKVRIHGVTTGTALGQRVYRIKVNGQDIFGMIDDLSLNGANQPYVFETAAMANAQGVLFFRCDKVKGANVRLNGVELILDESGDAAGAVYETRRGTGTVTPQKVGEGVSTSLDATAGGFTPEVDEVTWNGRLLVPSRGIYSFNKGAAGASNGYLLIDDQEVAPKMAAGTIALDAGVHEISYRYRKGTDANLATELRWSGPGVSERTVGGLGLSHASTLSAGGGEWNVEPIGLAGTTGGISPIGTNAMGATIWRIYGSGRDICDQHDQSFAAYKVVSGEFEVTARIRDIRHHERWPKVGVGIRTSLETTKGDYFWLSAIEQPTAGYTNSWVWACEGDDYRDGVALKQNDRTPVGLMTWVRIRRFRDIGGAWTTGAAYSKDGVTWTEKTYMNTTAKPVYAGLFACGTGEAEDFVTGFVDNLSIREHPTGMIIFFK